MLDEHLRVTVALPTGQVLQAPSPTPDRLLATLDGADLRLPTPTTEPLLRVAMTPEPPVVHAAQTTGLDWPLTSIDRAHFLRHHPRSVGHTMAQFESSLVESTCQLSRPPKQPE